MSPPPPGEDACEIAAVGSGRICEIRASKVPAAPPLCQRRCYDGHTLLFSQDKEDPFSGAISPVTERVPEVLRRHYMPGACRSAREPYEEGKCGFLRGAGDPEVLLIIRQNRLRDSAEPPGASAVILFFNRLTVITDCQIAAFLKHHPRELPKGAIFNASTVH